MRDYIDLAEKNGVILLDKGRCQFCGANTKRGVHECMEIFNLGFGNINFSKIENNSYRFLMHIHYNTLIFMEDGTMTSTL